VAIDAPVSPEFGRVVAARGMIITLFAAEDRGIAHGGVAKYHRRKLSMTFPGRI